MSDEIYHKLAKVLDTLPNGFPATESGVEIRLLKRIFQPEQAELFCDLRLTFETVEQIAERTGRPLEGLEEISRVIEVNVTATLLWLRALVPLMRINYCTTSKRAHVLLMSSRSGERTLPRLCPYTVAKGGVEKIADALKKIPPWGISYDEWLTVLMGLHTELGDAGLPLAEQWAEGKDGEVARKWRSFKKTGNTSGAVTIASVFALAKNY